MPEPIVPFKFAAEPWKKAIPVRKHRGALNRPPDFGKQPIALGTIVNHRGRHNVRLDILAASRNRHDMIKSRIVRPVGRMCHVLLPIRMIWKQRWTQRRQCAKCPWVDKRTTGIAIRESVANKYSDDS